MSDPQNWDFEELDDGRVGIKTSVLDEKRTAFQMVRIYIQQLQVGIASYLEILVTLMSEHIRFVFDDGKLFVVPNGSGFVSCFYHLFMSACFSICSFVCRDPLFGGKLCATAHCGGVGKPGPWNCRGGPFVAEVCLGADCGH